MNFNLDLVPTKYYDFVEPDSIRSYHHLSDNSKLYKVMDNGYLNLFSKNFIGMPEYLEGETSHIVRFNEINRIDLISWKYYKTPELFWVILAVNNILNPFEIEEGTVLRILPLSYIEYNLLRYNK